MRSASVLRNLYVATAEEVYFDVYGEGVRSRYGGRFEGHSTGDVSFLVDGKSAMEKSGNGKRLGIRGASRQKH